MCANAASSWPRDAHIDSKHHNIAQRHTFPIISVQPYLKLMTISNDGGESHHLL